ncbi:MAG: 50S ribosomal protein L15 [Chloroflexi bacterium]|nr:50S ribosomal protein L15 [Chloroflexota bacterium]HEV8054632.1 50S ribosomal protein L15 [Candidatus Limnocylindrales bacterium]
MKLHDLHPAPGSKTARTRVGRGISAGKGKTAGRGTKGQKARAGGSIPPWFEGGQTPLHMRVPKLRGFKNRGDIEYQVVNAGRISDYAAAGAFAEAEAATRQLGGKAAKAPITINPEVLHGARLVRSLRTPVKVLGGGEVTRPLFIVADAFTKSAREKIEAAGGTAQLLEVPDRPMKALRGEPAADEAGPSTQPEAEATSGQQPIAEPADEESVIEPADDQPVAEASAEEQPPSGSPTA